MVRRRWSLVGRRSVALLTTTLLVGCWLDLSGLDDGSVASSTASSNSSSTSSSSVGPGGAGGAASSVSSTTSVGGGAGGAPAVPLRVRYSVQTGSTEADQKITPEIDIVNDSLMNVALSDVTLRYWYTLNGATPTEILACDFVNAPLNCADVSGSFGSYNQPGALRYLELNFASSTVELVPQGQVTELKIRIQHPDSVLPEADDYSYDPNAVPGTRLDWNRITAYYRGQLAWGVEP